MFTGIIEETGKIQNLRKGGTSCVLTVECRNVLEDAKVGDSIAVNGICLTVTSLGSSYFTADVMNETLSRSGLASLGAGSPVNLERALAADGRFGGHIVSGHIDGTGTVTDIRADDNAVWYTVSAAPKLLRYIVEKGSIAMDGISLTVASVSEADFKVSVIPHTREVTALSRIKAGSTVNLECDIIGKYVEKLLGAGNLENTVSVFSGSASGSSGEFSGSDKGLGSAMAPRESRITEEFLREYGF